MINESGLYSLILTSKKADAKRFKKWVTSEVLPSIRRTGSYHGGVPAFIRRYNENWDRVSPGRRDWARRRRAADRAATEARA